MDGVSASELKRIDCQLKCKDLCRKLTELLFTSDELKSGNATEARTPGIKLLNSNRLYAIRGKLFFLTVMPRVSAKISA